MESLLVIDVQNEFTEKGKRPVVGIEVAREGSSSKGDQARKTENPTVWIRHFKTKLFFYKKPVL
ncbi:MAG TPA: hypothetical protein VF540_12855 [Segetibacter sp.]